MSLPFVLGYGQVSIYNVYQQGLSGVRAPSGFNFGYIDQISLYGIQYGTAVGQSVLFKGTDIECTINYGGWNYRLITEGAIIATELLL